MILGQNLTEYNLADPCGQFFREEPLQVGSIREALSLQSPVLSSSGRISFSSSQGFQDFVCFVVFKHIG